MFLRNLPEYFSQFSSWFNVSFRDSSNPSSMTDVSLAYCVRMNFIVDFYPFDFFVIIYFYC